MTLAQAIALHTFLTLWRTPRSATKPSEYDFYGYIVSHDALIKWLTTAAAWLFIFIIVILGSVSADPDERGDFCALALSMSLYMNLRDVFQMVLLVIGAG